MKRIIQDIGELANGNCTESFRGMVEQVGREDAETMAQFIFSFLIAGGISFPFKLRADVAWCKAVQNGLSKDSQFADVFQIQDWTLDFASKLTMVEKEEIASFLLEHYPPRFMV